MTIIYLTIIFSILAIICSLFVITVKNPIHSILYLILVFCNISFILIIWNVEFIAIIFLIVYVGAIAVLFLFVVMMLNIKIIELKEAFWRYIPVGFLISLIFILQIYILLFNNNIFEYIVNYLKINNLENIYIFNELSLNNCNNQFIINVGEQIKSNINNSIQILEYSTKYLRIMDSNTDNFINTVKACISVDKFLQNTEYSDMNNYISYFRDLSKLNHWNVNIYNPYAEFGKELNYYLKFFNHNNIELNLAESIIQQDNKSFSIIKLNAVLLFNGYKLWWYNNEIKHNTEILGWFLYNYTFYNFFIISLILLLAMVGSIVLVLNQNINIKRQQIYKQVSRNISNSIKLKY